MKTQHTLSKSNFSLPLGLGFKAYTMPTMQQKGTHCASVCTPDGFAMAQRAARLARELKNNLSKRKKSIYSIN